MEHHGLAQRATLGLTIQASWKGRHIQGLRPFQNAPYCRQIHLSEVSSAITHCNHQQSLGKLGEETTRELVAVTERVYNKREMEEQKEERREKERLRREKNKTESRKGT